MNAFDYFFEHTKELSKNFVLGSKEEISFSELYTNSKKIANFLNKTVGQNQNIILIAPNSVFFITVYLGILKSNNVCVPLNPAIEQENLDYICKITESSIVVTTKQIKKSLNLDVKLTLVDEDLFNEILVSDYLINDNESIKEDTLAEIIFTSGSTGSPKGVMISHKNIISNTSSIIEYLNLDIADTMCVVLPFYYCYGLSLLHTHLRAGASLVLNNTFIFLGTVINDLTQYKCTGFAGVPSHFQILLKKSQSFKVTHFPHLKYVTQAGGKLHNVFIEEFVHSFPKVKFYVMYGQTEATARLTYLPPDMLPCKIGSVGKAIPNVLIKVVDNIGQTVATDEEGELVAKGDNVMLGYYKDDEDTKMTIKNGWLYTGDIAKVDKDNFIYIVARKKEIIKVGGKRVSPKEIEDVILKIDEIVDCTIVGVQDEILGEALKAIIILNKLEKLKEVKNKIISKCKEKLALYKIPQFFEFDTKMNVKSTGKKNIK
ncbi:MAG: acyl--CoA ligase [Flavobacteriaceae bacterium]|nr:acyl--CoA ligase [Flavobacteriaceae bacterium]